LIDNHCRALSPADRDAAQAILSNKLDLLAISMGRGIR
jgi:hypothetical protein